MRTLLLFFKKMGSRTMYRIQTAHVLRSVSLSLVSVYVPAFLLTHGFSLEDVLLFFVLYHGIGLSAVFLAIVPLMRKCGIVKTIRGYFPLQMIFLGILFLAGDRQEWFWIAACIGGIANMTYYVPLNILFMRHTDSGSIAKDFSFFFALPAIFGIAGPILGAFLVVNVGFWSVFSLAFLGLAMSLLPLGSIQDDEKISLDISSAFSHLRRRKLLFFLEGFDNVVEESEWFWGILVYLFIGSLATPGIVGALESLGGALFTILVGRYVNKERGTLSVLFLGVVGLASVWVARFFVHSSLSAYGVTVASSFIMTLFLVSYFSMIYRKVKGDQDAEFVVMREIPTVVGRMVVFGIAWLTVSHVERFYFLPIGAMLILVLTVFFGRKYLSRSESRAGA